MKKIILITLLCTACGSDNTPLAPGGANGKDSLVFVVPSAPGCIAGGVSIISGIDDNRNGILELPEVLSVAEVCHGTNGVNAPTPAYQPVEILDPCGPTGNYDEVLLRLSNGQVLGSFSETVGGQNTRFTLLPDGSYNTTQGAPICSFSITTAGTQRCMNDNLDSHCWGL